jgi:N-methylhydantoinase B
MVTQAEHIPVHLGAMPEAVAAVRANDPSPGEPWILNDPYTGGTHLPDLTIVSRTELGFAVTRAHHADVGGADPGSLPAGSTTLAEEGVVIPPTRLGDAVLGDLVAQMRNPDERRGDLRAQLAAHRLGEQRVSELCAARARAGRGGDGGAPRVLRARRPGRSPAPDGRYEGTDALETADGLLELRGGHHRRQRGRDRLRRQVAPALGNLNCPSRSPARRASTSSAA